MSVYFVGLQSVTMNNWTTETESFSRGQFIYFFHYGQGQITFISLA